MRFILCILTLFHGLVTVPLVAQGVSVKEFGAVGDGKQDDSAAIQKAVNAHGSVVFPKGVYRIEKSIKVSLDKTGYSSLTGDGSATILMAGEGAAFYFSGTHEGSADPKQFKPQVWEKERMPVVRGLEIKGLHDKANGIEANGVMQLVISEVRIQHVHHAVHLVQRNRNVIISNCHFYENRGVGVFFDHVNLHQFNMTGTHISYNAEGGVVLRGGEVRNVHIGTCDIESNMTPDGPVTANVLIDCTGGSTAEVAITGCTIQHNSKSKDSVNVWLKGKGVTSAKNAAATQEGHMTITGNIFSDVSVNVLLQHARGVTITGNTFWEGFEHDLLVEDSQAVVVGPNDFDRNPRYVVNGNWAKDKNGIVFRRSQDCKLNGVLVKGVGGKEAAVLLEECHRFTVMDCSILDCDGVGLWLADCTQSMVSHCMIRDDREAAKATHSIKVTGGEGVSLHGNHVSHGVSNESGGKD